LFPFFKINFMAYSTNLLTTVADCELLLARAAKEKAELEFKILSGERDFSHYSTVASAVTADLEAINADIEATETVIAALPDGRTKEENQDKLVKLNYRKFILENRKENYNSITLLETEMEIAQLNQQKTEVAAFVTAVTSRKTALAEA
jgi:hypothetical protein